MVYFSRQLVRAVRALVISLIRLYQKTLSFDHGALSLFFPQGFCRFHPTCSEYAIQSIERFGLLRGGSRALYRIIRCNPFNRGGYDPVH